MKPPCWPAFPSLRITIPRWWTWSSATARRNLVLNAMLEDGKITASEATRAKAARSLNLQRDPNSLAPYFAEDVRRYLEKKYGSDEVHEGGLRVYTSLNAEMQSAANHAMLDGLALTSAVTAGGATCPTCCRLARTSRNTGLTTGTATAPGKVTFTPSSPAVDKKGAEVDSTATPPASCPADIEWTDPLPARSADGRRPVYVESSRAAFRTRGHRNPRSRNPRSRELYWH